MRVTYMTTTLVAAVAAGALAVAGSGPASAHTFGPRQHHAAAPSSVHVLTTKVFAPYHLDVDASRVLVADGGTSLVSRILDNGNLATVAAGPQPGEVAGVARGGGAVAYTWSNYATGATGLTIHKPGSADVVADLSGYEQTVNPDQSQVYGAKHASACARTALRKAGVPVLYKGVVDSHPYSVAYAGGGSWYVGDAAGNDILKVTPSGAISLVKVLPQQPSTITASEAASLGLPSCVVGVTYSFEPVPTGVRVGPGGWLYVSTLPGGPEDPSFGARGSVYRINPSSHQATRLATGFAGATDVAVSGSGTVYVVELFAGQITEIAGGVAQPVVSLPGVVSVAVSASGRTLYAGELGPTDDQGNPTGPGAVVKVPLA